jgi:uncharacterized protein YjbJ (UPF0337 family)
MCSNTRVAGGDAEAELRIVRPSCRAEKKKAHRSAFKDAGEMDGWIQEVSARIGLIQPFVVFPRVHGRFRILDGNKRFDILKAPQAEEVECVVATDGESYVQQTREVSFSSRRASDNLQGARAHLEGAGTLSPVRRRPSACSISIQGVRDERQVEGTAHELKGALKEKIGHATENADLEAEGKGEKIGAKFKRSLATSRRSLRSSYHSRTPL